MTRSRKSTTLRRRRVLARGLTAGILLLLLAPVRAEDQERRIVVLSTSKGLHRTAAAALVAELRTDSLSCELLVVPSTDAEARREAFRRLRELKPDVIAAGGASMTQGALEAVPNVPVVFYMVPNALDAPFLRADSPHRGRIAGVTSDVAPDTQVAWVRKTLPSCKRITVLCSAHSQHTAEALKVAARARGIEITAVDAKRDEFPAAVEALNGAKFDGVLMIPDAQVYNSPNVQRLLLWGLRQKKPVWAFSGNVVEAGALAGIYSDPTQVGRQAAELARQILRGQKPQSIGLQYPHKTSRAVNSHTAEMIGVEFAHDLLSSGVTKFGD